MKTNPLVSIIMNCHNGEKFLVESLQSIYNQTFTDWEIIFYDNASNDKSSFICKQYNSKLRYFYSKVKLELGHARTKALQEVKGKYIAFLDVDDVWKKLFLEHQVDILETNIDYQMSYTGTFTINEESNIIGQSVPKANSESVFKQQLVNYEVGFQSVLIRNNYYFTELSKNIKNFQFCPDYYLIMNIAKDKKVYVNKSCLMMYRKTSDSLTNKKPHRWSVEVKITLDNIFKNNLQLKSNLYKYVVLAYAKVYYKKADYFNLKNRSKFAILAMNKIKFVNLKYFILFLTALLGSSFWKYIHNRFKI